MNKICVKCGYQRKEQEDVPEWQCPSCHVAYAKVEVEVEPLPKPEVIRSEHTTVNPNISTSSFDNNDDIRKKLAPPAKKPAPKPLESDIIIDELHPNNAPVNRQWLGLTGSAMLALGVFAPLISMPVIGTVNYFANGIGDGVFVFTLAMVAMYMVFKQSYEKIWYPIGGSIVVILFTAFNYYVDARERLDGLRDNPFASELTALIQVQWGFGLLIIGLCFLVMCALRND